MFMSQDTQTGGGEKGFKRNKEKDAPTLLTYLPSLLGPAL
jgi:hypothetical protein